MAGTGIEVKALQPSAGIRRVRPVLGDDAHRSRKSIGKTLPRN